MTRGKSGDVPGKRRCRRRQQLQTLAAKTAELAAAVDPGAQGVIEQMKRQGVTLSAPRQ